MYKKLILLFCVVLAPVFGAGIEGRYRLSGYDPYQSKEYVGTAEIKKNGAVYEATWILDDKSERARGTGVKDGNDIVFVFQLENDPSGKYGAQHYKLERGGDVLRGSWIFLNGDQEGNEVLRRLEK